VNLVDADTGAISAHYEYDPFGRLVCKESSYADDNEYRFSTKRYCAMWSLYDYGYRHYSTDLGRWMSRDPIGEVGGLNLYSVIGNDCLSLYDILGLSSWYEIDTANTEEGFCKVIKILSADVVGRSTIETLKALPGGVKAVKKYSVTFQYYEDKERTKEKGRPVTMYPIGTYRASNQDIVVVDTLDEETAASILVHESRHRRQYETDSVDWTTPKDPSETRNLYQRTTSQEREMPVFLAEQKWRVSNKHIGTLSKPEFATLVYPPENKQGPPSSDMTKLDEKRTAAYVAEKYGSYYKQLKKTDPVIMKTIKSTDWIVVGP
jgi:RHS repeat-associated protein